MPKTTISPAEKTIAQLRSLYVKWHENQCISTQNNDGKILDRLMNEETPVSKLTPNKIKEIAERYQDYEPNVKTLKGKITNVLEKMVKAYNAEIFKVAYVAPTKARKEEKLPPGKVEELKEDETFDLDKIIPTLTEPPESIFKMSNSDIDRAVRRTNQYLTTLPPDDPRYKLYIEHLKLLLNTEAMRLN